MPSREVTNYTLDKNLGSKHVKLIENVLSLQPKADKELQGYTRHFLQSISFKILKTYRNSDLVTFINKRYNFFKKGKKEANYFFELNRETKLDKTVLDIVCPFAPHIFVTIEAVLFQLNINITFKAHPTIGDIDSSATKNNKFVVIYFEVEDIKDEELLTILKDKIDMHLRALIISYQNSNEIKKSFATAQKEFCSAYQTNKSKPDKNFSDINIQYIELLQWIQTNCFMFGRVKMRRDLESKSLIQTSQACGILSDDFINFSQSNILHVIEAFSWKASQKDNPNFIFSIIKYKSPILRFENLMCLKINLPNPKNKKQQDEYVFVGLLKGSSLHTKNLEVPIIKNKLEYIFNTKSMIIGGYEYNQVIRMCGAIPKFELFRVEKESLLRLVENVLSITNPNHIYCFKQNLGNKKFDVNVIIPLYFEQDCLDKTIDLIQSKIPHSSFEYFVVHGPEHHWIQFYFELLNEEKFILNSEELELEIKELTKSWSTRVFDEMKMHHSANISKKLCMFYLPLFPSHYTASSSPKETVSDILFLEQLAHQGNLQFNLTTFERAMSKLTNKVNLLYIYSRTKIDLDIVMPILQNFGLYVLDQINSRAGNSEDTFGYIQSYRIQTISKELINIKRSKKHLLEGIDAVFSKKTENDPLNSLILTTNLSWRDVNVIMLYRNYYLQLGTNHTREKINNTLIKNSSFVEQMFIYFSNKFNPDEKFGSLEYRKKEMLPSLNKKFINSLRNIKDISEDMILRVIFSLFQATLRTNYFVRDQNDLLKNNGETFISIKVDPQGLDIVPRPVPYREIYVHDVGFEALHIRFGGVARGGLRWSDRPDDFRTEVLGLVKTQQAKNVVIVPVGSKGGFVIKAKTASRDEFMQEGIKQYKKFISGMLEITDNYVNNQVVSPNHVLIYDALDPYLVVAADKGTASFSDIANSVSLKYNFWLGDAFASGGSVGYDHKKEGITARGAWECVKLHFRELGKDIQTEEFDVVGIGDMSGDVFGNGMLLSPKIRLKAAFNHIHIFLDPSPKKLDKHLEERQRLFNTPRSSWKDYNTDLFSKGGGVFDRAAKEIELTPELKSMLGCSKDVLNGEQLIKLVLKMNTDLIWFGGIGTYIKADNETDFQVGDQANNDVRINASECRAKVIGEGANLGLTQLARIEYTRLGGKLNTDAIDNSAGVNMSDYEVNIKIMLQQLIVQKTIKDQASRDKIFKLATNEVSELVLANNRAQHRLISIDQYRSKKNFKLFKFLINDLIKNSRLDPLSESIPTRGELERMDKGGEFLNRPILAKIQAYVKMYVYDSFLSGKIIDDAFFKESYHNYFPDTISNKFNKDLKNHQLKREIIATVITNKLINHAGMTFLYEVEESTGYHQDDIAKVYFVFDKALDGDNYRKKIMSMEVHEYQKYKAFDEYHKLVKYCCIRYLRMFGAKIEFSDIKSFSKLAKLIIDELNIVDKSSLRTWTKRGFSEDFAQTIVLQNNLTLFPSVINLYLNYKLEPKILLKLIELVDNIYGLTWLIDNIKNIEVQTDWELSHRNILLNEVENYKLSILNFMISNLTKDEVKHISSHIIQKLVEKHYKISSNNYLQTYQILKNGAILNLTSLAVGVSKLNFILE